MYDMITPMSAALPGDIITLKTVTKAQGYIIARTTPLFFVKLDREEQNIEAALDSALQITIKLAFRAIQAITSHTGEVKYQADPRDIVYGI